MSAVEAGAVLGLPADVVRALADAGYLRPASTAGVSPRFAMNDLKAFQARAVDDAGVAHSDDDEARVWGAAVDEDLEGAIIDALRAQVPRMARRTFELFAATVPGVPTDGERRERFEAEAAERIEAIIEVCARGPIDDGPLLADLAGIGADAARAAVPLPGMLVAIRTTRDLVVQTAVEIAEQRGRHWGLALTMVLTRVLPSIDRLSDAVARGYWEATVEVELEATERYRNVIEQASDGVVELDVDGIVRYANPALGVLLGVDTDELVDRPIGDVVPRVAAGEADAVVDLRCAGSAVRRFRVRQFERVHDGVVTGWDLVLTEP